MGEEFPVNEEVIDYLNSVLYMILDHAADRLDKQLKLCNVSIYWMGTTIRIDIKPK